MKMNFVENNFIDMRCQIQMHLEMLYGIKAVLALRKNIQVQFYDGANGFQILRGKPSRYQAIP